MIAMKVKVQVICGFVSFILFTLTILLLNDSDNVRRNKVIQTNIDNAYGRKFKHIQNSVEYIKYINDFSKHHEIITHHYDLQSTKTVKLSIKRHIEDYLSANDTLILDPLDLVPAHKHEKSKTYVTKFMTNCKNVHIYSPPVEVTDHKNNQNVTCVNMTITPTTPICVHNPEKDVYISRQIINDGIWEAHIVSKFQKILQIVGKNVGVVDLGANIGMYSLIAATMGHEVLAVEPFADNLLRFYKAIQLSSTGNHIIVLQNGISDVGGKGVLLMNNDNQGDVRIVNISNNLYSSAQATDIVKASTPIVTDLITLDCLIKYINKTTVIIKIDIQGYEYKAFVNFDKFITSIYVPYIFMEWVTMREHYGADINRSQDKTRTGQMINLLYHLGYKPYSQISGKLLHKDYWYGWPEDVLWEHELTDMLYQGS